MRITHDQAIKAVEIIMWLAKEAEDQKANVLILSPDIVNQITELSCTIQKNDKPGMK